MRIIEPRSPAPSEAKPKKRRRLVLPYLIILVLAFVGSYALFTRRKATAPELANVQNTDTTQAQATSSQPKLKVFTAEELKTFMDNFAYPNVSDVTDKPAITGNVAADERIRQLAEARGYRQRFIPNTSLVSVDGFLMQQKAVADWQELKANAQKAGLPLTLTSVFRPVDEQRQIFNERLAAAGATAASIAAGQSDAAVNKVLVTTSVPGYSKHHTGYTVDFMCGGVGLQGFRNTSCFRWLTANNYENAKLSGWIPSYPDGASSQGPDPEVWEYVWVGKAALLE